MNSLKVHSERTQKIALDLVANINLDKEWKFSLVEWEDSRSVAQNALMWKWHTIMGDDWGVSAKDAHKYIKEELLEPEITEVKGKVMKEYSTKNLGVKKMSSFLNKYLRWAATDMGIILPIPEELHYRG